MPKEKIRKICNVNDVKWKYKMLKERYKLNNERR